ncbi:pyridoxamine 5'-phosphate oxidase family protein [Nonomuraea rhodomycinica]|uniref:Pyridoxamine 5'-phosphate oxidase family protein n=1 Tax=Nonomuraea rhodomycinica TaxID=1712872 RepID=A0A7Y6MFD4_9ACTN|nr:pyridoxamine 5'-phosphate oxidase family protein [Nonomuraea rhodomycinica]NUW45872.1 pyridoxamine 5'-phosphate oxidase family protein [Nonomuraea rhodomycinica]
MANWREVTEAEPEFAARVRESFESHKHKTIATLRRDGSPRVSGIEAYIVGDDLWFGSMPGALKARDLRRDPRFALHGPPVLLGAGDSAPSPGDTKLSGCAVEVTDRDRIAPMLAARGHGPDAFPDSHFFRADIREVVLTHIEGSVMVIDLWRPGKGLQRLKRT